MKNLPAGMQEHLDSGATTLCWCWRLTRRDGLVLGFTDHDRDVMFDGVVFEAAAGFTASEIKDAVGLGVDNLDVEGALQSGRLDEDQLAAGAFDDARVEIFRVNWQAPSQRMSMRTGSIGEVKRRGQSFVAEVRGLAHYLNQPNGRLFQYTCDADLGDHRCSIALAGAQFTGAGTIVAGGDARIVLASGLGSYADDWFTRGLLKFVSGANAGRAMDVKRHTGRDGLAMIELWQELASMPAPGDTFSISAGCDKHLATCRDRFGNVVRFRGFPHMPGNDFITAYAPQA